MATTGSSRGAARGHVAGGERGKAQDEGGRRKGIAAVGAALNPVGSGRSRWCANDTQIKALLLGASRLRGSWRRVVSAREDGRPDQHERG